MRRRQLEFQISGMERHEDWFGGSYLKNSHAKRKRPLDSRFAIHTVLRAQKGGMRLPKTLQSVNRIVRSTCQKHGVRLYEYANVGNHLHLLIKIPHVRRWSAFIRELTGRIAQYMQTILTEPKSSLSFWKQRPFTRIVRSWKKAYKIAKDYVVLNQLEAEGFISRSETKTLKDLREIWADG